MTDFSILMKDVALRLLGEPSKALSKRTELRFGSKGSLSIDLDKGTWFDWESNEGGGVIDLIKRELPGESPIEWLQREGLVEKEKPKNNDPLSSSGTRQIEFSYHDELGITLFQVIRVERADTGKSLKVWQRRPDGRGGWVNKLGDVRRVLYRLPELIAADASLTVFVAEGEKKAETLARMGLVATCNPHGAGKWREEYSKFFKGRDVIVLPDNDPQARHAKTGEPLWHPDGRPKLPGQDHAQAIARSLFVLARSVRILMLPDLPPKGDVVDWVASGGTRDALETLAAAAPPWQPPPIEGVGAGEPVPPEFSEEALALKLSTRHADNLRYVALWGKWYRWIGTYWRQDEVREAFNLSRQVCREAAALVNNPGLSRSVASAKMRAAVLSLTCEDPRIAATSAQWDSDPWSLATPKGTVDLRSGRLRDTKPDDYSTKITAVAPGGSCPLWIDFLNKVTAGNVELRDYLQRACGYMLTGVTREHAMFFLYGLGANGKSTFINAITGVLGGYHTTAQIETFTASPQDRHPTELASLRGARLVTSMETEEGRRWAESRIKSLTGGDRISARFMRQDFFEFTPTFKLAIFGNHMPGLRSVDEAIRRRMNLWPFKVVIPETERDKNFGERLATEGPGILTWMIDGCLSWQQRGLDPPAVVVAATEKYLDQEDIFKSWFDDCCITDKQAFTPIGWIFTSWKRWAERNGEYVGSQKTLSQRLESGGFLPDRVRVSGSGKEHPQRGYRGLSLGRGQQAEFESEANNPF